MLFADQTSQTTEFGIQVATSTLPTTTTARPKREPTSQEKFMMIEAAKIGNITVFNAIFDDGIIDPNAVIGDTFGDAALHYAAYWGRIISHTIHISYTQQSYLIHFIISLHISYKTLTQGAISHTFSSI